MSYSDFSEFLLLCLRRVIINEKAKEGILS